MLLRFILLAISPPLLGSLYSARASHRVVALALPAAARRLGGARDARGRARATGRSPRGQAAPGGGFGEIVSRCSGPARRKRRGHLRKISHVGEQGGEPARRKNRTARRGNQRPCTHKLLKRAERQAPRVCALRGSSLISGSHLLIQAVMTLDAATWLKYSLFTSKSFLLLLLLLLGSATFHLSVVLVKIDGCT